MDALWSLSFPWWQFVLRGVIVYVAILALIRITGKREIGQMGSGEFVAILLVSNAVQNSMNGGDESVTGGLILASVVMFLSFTESILVYRSRIASRLIEASCTILIKDGVVLENNLKKERLRHRDLDRMLRENGLDEPDDVHLGILESNGRFSVVEK